MDQQRSVLPIPDQSYAGDFLYDVKDDDTKFPPIEPLRQPAGAPNVLIILLDDVDLCARSASGGPISTLTAERIAASGLKYARLRTTALGSPTRQASPPERNVSRTQAPIPAR